MNEIGYKILDLKEKIIAESFLHFNIEEWK